MLELYGFRDLGKDSKMDKLAKGRDAAHRMCCLLQNKTLLI